MAKCTHKYMTRLSPSAHSLLPKLLAVPYLYPSVPWLDWRDSFYTQFHRHVLFSPMNEMCMHSAMRHGHPNRPLWSAV
ncbi:hypothetical protein OPQ81_007240 [Rhizoctonia solani]|nr:hypothetical protein OPQ81_007240 [Rhizoctonia solani]